MYGGLNTDEPESPAMRKGKRIARVAAAATFGTGLGLTIASAAMWLGQSASPDTLTTVVGLAGVIVGGLWRLLVP